VSRLGRGSTVGGSIKHGTLVWNVV
jgi:hypothetical protein